MDRVNHTSSAHYLADEDIRMALKTTGFLAAIERGAHFIYQANPGKTIAALGSKTLGPAV